MCYKCYLVWVRKFNVTEQLFLRLLLMNKVILFLFLFLFMSKGLVAKEAIFLENGIKVDNCTDYNKYRKFYELKLGVNNEILSSKYLECSIDENIYLSVDSTILSHLYEKLRVRQFPLSIGPKTSRKLKFKDVGFILDYKNASISYKNEIEDVYITIFLKGKIINKTDSYLLWVYDEKFMATYRAYYPIIVRINKDDIDILPFY